jgi:transposase
VIDYETFCKIRLCYREGGLNLTQIARELGVHPQTVAKYAALDSYHPPRPPRRKSKLDPFKPTIQRWLERYPYSAMQILQRLRAEEGYEGGFSILKDYVRRVHPVRKPAFLTLAFAPGECAQVDWGCAGALQTGSTRRRLSFFVMVLCYSRMIYVEFTLGEALEPFLAATRTRSSSLALAPAPL